MSTCTVSSVQNATALTKEKAPEAADACRASISSMQDIWHTSAACLHADDFEKRLRYGVVCRMARPATIVPGLNSTDGSEDSASGGLLPCTFDIVWRLYNSLALKLAE